MELTQNKWYLISYFVQRCQDVIEDAYLVAARQIVGILTQINCI